MNKKAEKFDLLVADLNKGGNTLVYKGRNDRRP